MINLLVIHYGLTGDHPGNKMNKHKRNIRKKIARKKMNDCSFNFLKKRTKENGRELLFLVNDDFLIETLRNALFSIVIWSPFIF